MTQQSPDMVERVARSICFFEKRDWRLFVDAAKAAIEASHHAECIRELKNASWLLADVDPNGLVKRQIDALLVKIGGDA